MYAREKKINLLWLVIKRFLGVRKYNIRYVMPAECYKRAASGSDFTTMTVNGFYDFFFFMSIYFILCARVFFAFL